MTAYCLDSDVIIWHLRKGARSEEVTEYLKRLASQGTLLCSALSVMEVEQGMRPAEVERTRGFLRSIQVQVLDQSLVERAAEIVRDLRSRGITMGLADALIAATALSSGATLVTLNVQDFENVPGLTWETVP